MFNVGKAFSDLRKRNKILFTIIISISIILFWKGTWGILDIIFDTWIFGEHLFWSNLTAMIIGIAVLSAAGLVLDKLA